MYTTQPFVRSRVGFLPQRKINSFPPGACNGFEGRKDIFYSERERDFLVNMAGCTYLPVPINTLIISWGRNCLEEMTHFKQLSDKLDRFRWWKLWTWL
jgi:mannan polymerase II complex MNN10 subunit